MLLKGHHTRNSTLQPHIYVLKIFRIMIMIQAQNTAHCSHDMLSAKFGVDHHIFGKSGARKRGFTSILALPYCHMVDTCTVGRISDCMFAIPISEEHLRNYTSTINTNWHRLAHELIRQLGIRCSET